MAAKTLVFSPQGFAQISPDVRRPGMGACPCVVDAGLELSAKALFASAKPSYTYTVSKISLTV